MSPSSSAAAPSGTGTGAVRTVVLPVDLHARPAGLLVRTATSFTAAITLSAGERSASARSVLEVMGLGAAAGTEVVLVAEGADAETAVASLAELLMSAVE